MRPTNQLLKTEIVSLEESTVTEIKDAYYKAAEGLRSLTIALHATLIEAEDQTQTEELSEEYKTALAAFNALNKSELGAIL